MPTVLGISGSLRNGRFGVGSQLLIDEIKQLSDKDALKSFLQEQTKIRNDDFFKAGREEGLAFDELYKNIQKQRGDRGLSNSEACLVSALWSTYQTGCDIAHCSLSEFFENDGHLKDEAGLKKAILAADGLILAGPVYFGDRGSLAHDFIKFMQSDPDIKAHIKGKPFAGVSVGAKRNGGQETTLIYQLLDMVNSHMLGVGNDSSTTSQYGGTSVGGDVGTVWEDDYGLNTCIGTGDRIGRVMNMLDAAKRFTLQDPLKVAIWLVQDTDDDKGYTYIQNMISTLSVPGVQFDVVNLTRETVMRCIACDVCPTKNGPNSEYRCIIKSNSDLFKRHHQRLIDSDAIIIASYSSVDRSITNDIYQRFMERTRYLRRGDYVFSNQLVTPMVISEIGSRENLHLRMLTSMIRHHTVLYHPIIGTEYEGQILEEDKFRRTFEGFLESAKQMTAGRIAQMECRAGSHYNPVGYTISTEKLKEEQASGLVDQLSEEANQEALKAKERIKEIS